MSGKKINIFKPGPLFVPGDLFGLEGKIKVPNGHAIEVPLSYGKHLIDDGIAFEANDNLPVFVPSDEEQNPDDFDFPMPPKDDEKTEDPDDDFYSGLSEEVLKDLCKKYKIKGWQNAKIETMRVKLKVAIEKEYKAAIKRAQNLEIETNENWDISDYYAAIAGKFEIAMQEDWILSDIEKAIKEKAKPE